MRIGRGDRDRAARHRAARLDLRLRDRQREARERVQHAAAPGGREVDEVDLRVEPMKCALNVGRYKDHVADRS